jgi:hypothetical protein
MRPNTLVAMTTFPRRPRPARTSARRLLGDAFAHLPTIDVGRVEEVDAQFQGVIHDGE